MAGFIGGLGALAGGYTQGAQQAWQQALQQQAYQQSQQQNQGQNVLGSALMQLYGGTGQSPQGGGAAPGGPLGSIPMPMTPQQGGATPPPAGPTNLMPQVPVAPPPQASAAQAAPIPPQGAPPPQQPPMGSPGPSGGAPMGPAGPQGGPPQRPPGSGNLTLPDLVRSITQARPGIKPGELAAAVNAAIPMMNAQGLQDWRQMQYSINKQNADTRGEVAATGAKKEGAEETHWANQDEAAKARIAQNDKKLEGIQARSDANLKEKYDALKQTKDNKDVAQKIADIRSAQKEQMAAIQKELNVENLPDGPEKEKLRQDIAKIRQQADDDLDEAIKAQRDFQSRNSSTAQPEKAEPGKAKDTQRAGPQASTDQGSARNPMQVKTAEEADKLPPDTIFILDGKTYQR